MLLTRSIFWIAQLVGFCIAAPIIIDPSCPCGPFDTERTEACCLTGSEIIPEENSTDQNETDATVDSMEVTTEFSTTDAEESFEEYSATEAQTTVTGDSSDVTVPSLNVETSKNVNEMNIDAAENENRTEKTASADASRDPENEATFGDANRTLQREQPRYLNGLPFTEPRQINLGILNKIASSIRFPQRRPDNEDAGERDENIDRFVFRGDAEEGQPEIQNLIDEVTMFESVRISPKERVPFLIRESRERERQDLERKTNFLVSGRTAPSKALPPVPKSVSEKMSNSFERKTLLEAPFTVDGVTSGATNENAKRLGRLDTTSNGDTSIRNLWDPEGVGNIQRFTRSRMSEIEDRSKENVENREDLANKTGVASSTLDGKENKSHGGRASVRGFKRPPRILPIKNVRSTEVDSSKFVNSRERARSLFNKSNQVRRKHLSISKNRNDFDTMIHETKE